MQLSARVLAAVASVNNFRVVQQIRAEVGDTFDLYLQLTDLEQFPARESWNPPGLRYDPPATSTLQLTLKSMDSAKVVTRAAAQPFTQDPSVWRISVLGTDPVRGTVDIKGVLTEPGGVTRSFSLPAAVLVGDDTGVC